MAANASRAQGRRRTVVVGYDGSVASREALAHAVDRAGSGGLVVVVHAYGAPADFLGTPYYQRILEDRQAHGRAVLAGILLDGNAELLDTEFETELLADSPAEALLRVAQARDADEIVVGSRGFGRARALLGSTSHQLLHIADRPVLVVPERAAVAAPESTPA